MRALPWGFGGDAPLMRHRWIILGLAVVVFGLDRVVQLIVTAHMTLGQSIAVWPPLLWITYITNSGAAFSLFQHGTFVFVAVGLLILAGLAWYVVRSPRLNAIFSVGAGLMAGGTAGNLWDRMVAGRVVDYVHFRDFAIFNVADAGIVAGIILIIIDFWRKDHEFYGSQKG